MKDINKHPWRLLLPRPYQQQNLLPWRLQYMATRRPLLLAMGSFLGLLVLSVVLGLYGLYWHRQQQLSLLQQTLYAHAEQVQQHHRDSARLSARWLDKQAALSAWRSQRRQSDVPATCLLWVQQVAKNINAQVRLVQWDGQTLMARFLVTGSWQSLQFAEGLFAGGHLQSVTQVNQDNGSVAWLLQVGLSQ